MTNQRLKVFQHEIYSCVVGGGGGSGDAAFNVQYRVVLFIGMTFTIQNHPTSNVNGNFG